jgi:hypothetical protein
MVITSCCPRSTTAARTSRSCFTAGFCRTRTGVRRSRRSRREGCQSRYCGPLPAPRTTAYLHAHVKARVIKVWLQAWRKGRSRGTGGTCFCVRAMQDTAAAHSPSCGHSRRSPCRLQARLGPQCARPAVQTPLEPDSQARCRPRPGRLSGSLEYAGRERGHVRGQPDAAAAAHARRAQHPLLRGPRPGDVRRTPGRAPRAAVSLAPRQACCLQRLHVHRPAD